MKALDLFCGLNLAPNLEGYLCPFQVVHGKSDIKPKLSEESYFPLFSMPPFLVQSDEDPIPVPLHKPYIFEEFLGIFSETDLASNLYPFYFYYILSVYLGSFYGIFFVIKQQLDGNTQAYSIFYYFEIEILSQKLCHRYHNFEEGIWGSLRFGIFDFDIVLNNKFEIDNMHQTPLGSIDTFFLKAFLNGSSYYRNEHLRTILKYRGKNTHDA